MSDPRYEEALAAAAIHRICKGARRRWVPLQIEDAMRQHEESESRARIAKEKQKWLDNVNISR